MRCSIVGCKSHQLPQHNISLHRLYREGKFNEDWIKAILSLNGQYVDTLKPTKIFTVCDLHFERRFLRNLGPNTHLTPDAIPTIFPKMFQGGIKDYKLEESDVKIWRESENIPNNVTNEEFSRKKVHISEKNDYSNRPLINLNKAASSSGVKVYRITQIQNIVLPPKITSAEVSTPNLSALVENTQTVRKRKEKFNIDQASPSTIKKKCIIYMDLYKKKNNILKVLRRKLVRKENKIKSLNARIIELENIKIHTVH